MLQNSIFLVAAVLSCRAVTNSAFITTGPGISGDALTFQRNCVGLFAENDDGGKEIEQTGVPDTFKEEGRKHDMTDRFKYKVNALMGTYDPQNRPDDESQDGNILEAMLNFPVRYTFNAVGKTNGDEAVQDEYVEEVKKVVLATSGDEDAKWEIVPRGTKFTKVQCEVEVQSSVMVNTIYEDISKLEKTVMRF